MPNGRSDPCCLSCQWSTQLKQSKTGSIFCAFHKIEVRYAAAMFCSDLSHSLILGLAAFIQRHQFEPGMLYEWISAAANSQWYSYFPGYEHSPTLLASLYDYQSMSPEAILERIKMNRTWRFSGQGG